MLSKLNALDVDIGSVVMQSGRYANQQGHGSDAVMLEVRSNAIEAGVQLALQHLVHPQRKWDIRKDVQVQSFPHGRGLESAYCTRQHLLEYIYTHSHSNFESACASES